MYFGLLWKAKNIYNLFLFNSENTFGALVPSYKRFDGRAFGNNVLKAGPTNISLG